MSCNCNKAKPLPSCVTSIVLGEVADTGETYSVILETPDGHRDKYDATNVYGTLKMAFEPEALRTGTEYKVWLTNDSAGNIEEKTELTIGDTDEITCILIEFYPVFDTGNDFENFVSQEISLVW